MRHQMRHSAGLCGDNLEVVQGATVSKILLEGSTAVGVQYVLGNDSAAEPEVVMAAREVVLAAGPYNSPKLLMVCALSVFCSFFFCLLS